MIRLAEAASTTSEATYEFIKKVVESGSEIITKLPLDTKRLETIGYQRKISSANYQSSKASAVYSDLQKELDCFPPAGPLADYLNLYCAKVNSRKTPMDFTELLQRAIQMEPQPKSRK